ncbi:MAG: hypothetical protein IPO60_09800 [Flavobacteriales bacterium]|jgi:hypothetical protein|nr:hypothetical protein [Flavobacteriales bacterium]MBK7247288.1 hypothetical protein [Flavobacteriales bacterium]MBK9598584.1 hypothetical protein [Flavobacteriales bacterium]HQY04141.1 hypothetical protein [Flavobacteriales bacterium]
MEELNPEIKRLRTAVDKLRQNNAGDIEDAVGIIEDVIGELAAHDCDDYASECPNCEWNEGSPSTLPDIPYVKECLELGLPALIERYGLNSDEVQTAQRLMDDQA